MSFAIHIDPNYHCSPFYVGPQRIMLDCWNVEIAVSKRDEADRLVKMLNSTDEVFMYLHAQDYRPHYSVVESTSPPRYRLESAMNVLDLTACFYPDGTRIGPYLCLDESYPPSAGYIEWIRKIFRVPIKSSNLISSSLRT